ncbi:MAG: hypothetical protein KGJ13_11720 [Patescibacteria group bacterium]|nr:hypothetical protein [Patescibacteria group bacterium]
MNRYHFDEKRHLHTLDGKPLIGTSSACKIIGKGDALTWWAAGMALEPFGFLNKNKHSAVVVKNALGEAYKRITALSPSEYETTLLGAYRRHDEYKKTKAVEGTARHAALELYVKQCMENDGAVIPYQGENPFVAKFAIWAEENVARFLWSEMHCFSERLWVGGIADVGWKDKQGMIIAGDFKSSKEAYFDQFVQVAAYALQIQENGGFDANGNATFALPKEISGLCIIPFGSDDLSPEFEFDIDAYKHAFVEVVGVYRLSQAFSNKKGTARAQ